MGGRAWDSFGLSRVAIIINSLFLTNDRVFALPRIKGPGFARRRIRLIFLTDASGSAQSAARSPCGVLTVIPRIESQTFRWMVPTTLVLFSPSALCSPVRTYRGEPSHRCHPELPRTAGTASDDLARLLESRRTVC